MKYAKVNSSGIIEQVQPNNDTGFVSVPNNAICGMHWDGAALTTPQPVYTGMERTRRFSGLIETIAIAELKKYNEANNIDLQNPYACYAFSQVPTYTHKAFCTAFWDWYVNAFETVRALPASQQPDKAVIPPFVFGG